MLFNSLYFFIFLPIVFLLYWFVFKKNKDTQNFLLLVASFYFYACWDFRFLFLLVFVIILNYITGLGLQASANNKYSKIILYSSVILNIGILAFFKYFNFFIESFNNLLQEVGINQSLHTLAIILPVGISFYTFHGLSYIFDINNKKIQPTKNFIAYSVFVSYFPLLVAGPIERASHFLPQLSVKRKFNYLYATEGLKQILWGLFKKIAVADLCAVYANTIFDQSETAAASTLLLGAFYFTIQIYCDFSGYTDIALGVSKLFGITLLKNFNYPYFSRDIAEFWRRWHISLSSWFRDYLYFPLGGSRGGMYKTIRNTFIIFLVSGFWHGANWTYIVWGGLNALYIMPSIVMKQNRKNLDVVAMNSKLPSLKEGFNILVTFVLTMFAWIIFRATDLSHAYHYIINIFNKSIFTVPQYFMPKLWVVIIILFVFEWIGRKKDFALDHFGCSTNRFFRWCFYFIIMILICICYTRSDNQFIYFQF